jgi:hypothetical protein
VVSKVWSWLTDTWILIKTTAPLWLIVAAGALLVVDSGGGLCGR